MCIVRLVTTRQLFGLYRQLYFSFLAYYFHLLYLVHVFIYYFVVSYFAFFFFYYSSRRNSDFGASSDDRIPYKRY